MSNISVILLGEAMRAAQRRLEDQQQHLSTTNLQLENKVEAQSLLAAIVASSDDAIVSKTLDGKITSWNKGAERLFGYTAQEAIGQSIHLIVPPEGRDQVTGILDRIRHGERVEHLDVERVRKDGARLSVSLTVSPVHDRHGHIIGASKTARDITLRKAWEAELRESRDVLSFAMQAGRMGAWSRDLTMNTVWWSPEIVALFGLDPGDMAAQPRAAAGADGARGSRAAAAGCRRGAREETGLRARVQVSARADRRMALDGSARPRPLRRQRQADHALRARHRHHRSRARRGGAAGSGSPEGRIPRHAGARAAQSARAHQLRPAYSPHRRRQPAGGGHGAPDHGAPGGADGAPGRRSARRGTHHHRQGGAALRAHRPRRRDYRRGGNQPPVDRGRGPAHHGDAARPAGLRQRRSHAARAGLRQPPQQQLEVQRSRPADLDRAHPRGRPGGGTGARRRRGHSARGLEKDLRHVRPGRSWTAPAPAAVSASASRWSGASPTCTAAPSRRTARGSATAANSWCAFQRSRRRAR